MSDSVKTAAPTPSSRPGMADLGGALYVKLCLKYTERLARERPLG